MGAHGIMRIGPDAGCSAAKCQARTEDSSRWDTEFLSAGRTAPRKTPISRAIRKSLRRVKRDCPAAVTSINEGDETWERGKMIARPSASLATGASKPPSRIALKGNGVAPHLEVISITPLQSAGSPDFTRSAILAR